MSTLVFIFSLAVAAIVAGVLQAMVFSIAGIPGQLIAGAPEHRTPTRFYSGMVLSSIGQLYVYLAYTAWVVSRTLTTLSTSEGVAFIVWPAAIIAVVLPLWINFIGVRIRSREVADLRLLSAAQHVTVPGVFIGLFVFALWPTAMRSLWFWVPGVS